MTGITIVPVPKTGVYITAAEARAADKINIELRKCKELERQAGEANKAVAAAVVKQWAKVGKLFEKEKAKLDAKNEKLQKENVTNKQWNKRNPDKKQRKIHEIERWQDRFEDKKSTENASDSVDFSYSKPVYECTQFNSERYRKVSTYPKLATLAVLDTGKHDINVTYQQLSEASKEKEADARTWLGEKTLAAKFAGNDEWYTPKIYIDAARNVMGGIDTDPASNNEAQKMIGAKAYYTAENSGLDASWSGNVWMNPPYSKKLMPMFMGKLLNEWDAGHITQAVVLTNNNTDTSWFHDAAEASSAICFTRGRISFYCGDEESSPTNGQAFFYFGDNAARFAEVFSAFGLIVGVSNGVV